MMTGDGNLFCANTKYVVVRVNNEIFLFWSLEFQTYFSMNPLETRLKILKIILQKNLSFFDDIFLFVYSYHGKVWAESLR